MKIETGSGSVLTVEARSGRREEVVSGIGFTVFVSLIGVQFAAICFTSERVASRVDAVAVVAAIVFVLVAVPSIAVLLATRDVPPRGLAARWRGGVAQHEARADAADSLERRRVGPLAVGRGHAERRRKVRAGHPWLH